MIEGDSQWCQCMGMKYYVWGGRERACGRGQERSGVLDKEGDKVGIGIFGVWRGSTGSIGGEDAHETFDTRLALADDQGMVDEGGEGVAKCSNVGFVTNAECDELLDERSLVGIRPLGVAKYGFDSRLHSKFQKE